MNKNRYVGIKILYIMVLKAKLLIISKRIWTAVAKSIKMYDDNEKKTISVDIWITLIK